MKACGLKDKKLGEDVAVSSGQTVQDMKDIGITTKLTAEEDLFMQMVTSMRANGSMIKRMAKVFIFTQTVPDTKVTGSRIPSMASARRLGQMVPHTKVNTVRVRNTGMVCSHGLITVSIQEISRTITLKDRVSTNGLMAVFIMDNGWQTKCTVMAYSNGPMAECIPVNISKT